MEIIRAAEQHLGEILNLCNVCAKTMQSKGIDQWDEIYPNLEVFQNDLKSNSLYLAFIDAPREILGCIALNACQDPEYKEIEWAFNQGEIAVIHRLMVHPQYEGKGIAGKLVEFVEGLAKERGYASLRLDVFSQNLRAVNFYKKRGYKISGKVNFRKGEFLCCEKML